MRQRWSRITVFLLVVAAVLSGLAGCTRQADERQTEATASPASTEAVEAPAGGVDVTPVSGADVTPAPGGTHIAAVTSTPQESSAVTQIPPQQPTEQASAGAAPTAAEASAEATPVAEPEDASVTEVHVVIEGETLTAIAARYSTSVRALQELNDIEDPESIQAGQELKIPVDSGSGESPTRTPDCRYVHQVKKGETVIQIAERYSVKPKDIVRANKIKDWNKIYPSMTLCIP